MKDIEHVVKNATNTWKNIYLLHKPSDFPIIVDDNNDDDKDEEGDDEETTNFVTIDYEDYKEQEATKKETQDDEEIDLVKIATIVIASLPHSPRKLVTTSSTDTALTRLTVTISVNTNAQSLFAPIQLSTSLIEMTSTSSTKL